MQLNAHVNSYV